MGLRVERWRTTQAHAEKRLGLDVTIAEVHGWRVRSTVWQWKKQAGLQRHWLTGVLQVQNPAPLQDLGIMS